MGAAGLLSLVFWFSEGTGHGSARWECGNRASDFQGQGETRETCFWFSSFSTARHFHGAPDSSCGFALLPKSEK